MTDIELATVVSGIVAAIRRQYRQVDGPFVFAAVICVSAVVCWVQVPGTANDKLLRSMRVALEAIAGVSLAGYVAGKAATGVQFNTYVPGKDATRESPTRPDMKSIPPSSPAP